VQKTSEELLFLVQDALNARRMEKDARIVSNADGDELAECNAAALPVIEHVIEAEIVPQLKDTDPHRLEFVGLGDVLGAYIIIGLRYDESRVLNYLRKSPDRLKAKMLGAIPGHFYKPYGEFNFGVAPTAGLLDFIRDQQYSNDENIRNEAVDVLELLAKRLGTVGGS
jgi:hypothetical protein